MGCTSSASKCSECVPEPEGSKNEAPPPVQSSKTCVKDEDKFCSWDYTYICDKELVVGTGTVPPMGGYSGAPIVARPTINVVTPDSPVTLNNGIYTGQWEGENANGHGVIDFSTGLKYKGQLLNGFAEGDGKLSDQDKTIYVGQFSRGRFDGNGSFFDSDGSSYVGGWKENLKNGDDCIETWTDGTKYTGSFREGIKEGSGLLKFPDGSEYNGQFSNDLFSGIGTYKWTNGISYQGQWEEGIMNGTGRFTYPNAPFTSYEGECVNGIREGKGKLFFLDGRVFEGQFQQCLPHGIGFEISDGQARKGEWNGGKLLKWLTEEPAFERVVKFEEKESNNNNNNSSPIVIFSNPALYHPAQKDHRHHKVLASGIDLDAERTAAIPKPDEQGFVSQYENAQ